jgi:MYXO-CTERM domain-containing protein
LDNVSASIPDGGLTAMLLGMGLLGLGSLRRRIK